MSKRTAFLAGYQAVVVSGVVATSAWRQAINGEGILGVLLFIATFFFGVAIWFPLWLVRWK